ncbi:MAG: GntR family transcriptional regulator, partial [Bryobacteraceae bacterium]
MTKSAIRTHSSTPIRLQLSQILRQSILDGRFPAGARIPSERDLAERYGISRASVRESITELIQAGVLFRTVGKGTFVSDRRQPHRIDTPDRHEGICFAISDGVFHFVQTGYNRILSGVEAACRDAGLRLFFQSVGEGIGPTWETGGALPAGCLVVGGVGRHVLDRFRESGIPYVLVDLLITEDSADHVAVRIDYATGTRAAMDHLYALNHRTFGFIGFAGSEKYKAYWKTLQDYGLPYDPRHVEFLSALDLQPGMVAGYRAMQRMIAAGELPTCLLVVNDFAAMGVFEQLQIAGMAIPGDISIVGFDDLGHYASPPLTTVRVDLHRVGRLAAEALFRKLNGEEVENEEYVV